MDSTREQEVPGDLSALAWVRDELRRTLDTANKSLRRHLRDLDQRPTMAGGQDDVVPPALLQARALVHQAVGALQMIGLPAPARCLNSAEQALQRLAANPAGVSAEAVAVLERVSFATLDYLQRLLAGQDVSPLAMFPQYRAALTLAGADRIHPADLWQAPPAEALNTLPAPAAPLRPDARVRSAIESAMLGTMRGDTEAQRRMSRLFGGLAAGAQGRTAGLWQLASAFYEAQAAGLLGADPFSQRMTSRLSAHLGAMERGVSDVPERLLQDLQFFCARARDDDRHAAPQLARVRQALGQSSLADVDYLVSPLGRFDPALVPQARRRVGAFKDIWALASAGDVAVLPVCGEQATLVADSARQLYPDGERLGQALQRAVSGPVAQGAAPGPELAMEVATALLCVEASLDDQDFDRPERVRRIQRLSERMEHAADGLPPEPVEPWMEELYREASDRQTMGSVVQELRAALAEVEQQLDRYNRHPDERDLLIPVPAQLATMRGVLSVLGLNPASQAVQRMRDDVDSMMAGQAGAEAAAARLADNLGGLSFLIDMLGVQPQLAKTLFRFDPDSGRFSAVMGRGTAGDVATPAADATLMERVQALADTAADERLSTDDLSHQLDGLAHQAVAADEPALADTAKRARQALHGAEDTEQRDAARADLAQAFSTLSQASQPQPPAAVPGDEHDDMREVFFEEADEVIAQAREAVQALAQQPRDLEAMTGVRRAFHTLKGSARMVGLGAFGEAAWACEQLFNARLATAEVEADLPLQHFTSDALSALQQWVDALRSGGDASAFDETVWVQRAAALRQAAPAPAARHDEPEEAGAQPVALAADLAETPAVEPVMAEPPTAVPVGANLPLDLDLDLSAAEPEASADEEAVDPRWEPTAAQMPVDLDPAVDFELDLDVDWSPAPAPVPAPEPPVPLPEPPLPVMAEAAAEPMAGEPVEPESEPALSAADDADRYKIVGPLRIPITLFNIYLNEADEQSRRLCVDLAEWQMELDRPASDEAVALAHSLAGNSATVGYVALSGLARRLEHALERTTAWGTVQAGDARLLLEVADELRRLLHQFAAGFLRPVPPELDERLADFEARESSEITHHAALDESPALDSTRQAWTDEPALGEVRFSALRTPEPAPELPEHRPAAASSADAPTLDALQQNLDAVDAIDPELFEFFAEEAQDLIPTLAQQLREWEKDPAELGAGVAAMRTLHTLKGGARLAGAMRLGEMAHRLEGAIEHLSASGPVEAGAVAALQLGVDALSEDMQRLLGLALPEARSVGVAAALPVQQPADVAAASAAVPAPGRPEATQADAVAPPDADAAPVVDWSRLAPASSARGLPPSPAQATDAAAGGSVRVRGPLLDRLVNHAGEVGIARARIETDVTQMRGQLRELTDNLERLRRQLRDLELQAETQMSSRMEAARHAQQAFDPLEMDRFTRVQELTRMLAESVGDVGTVQRSLQQSLQSSEDQLAAQARLTRDLQDDLLRARMVEFDTLSDRLYRVVRQAAKESGKQVRLNLTGGSVEVDRSVLDRMAPAFEHLLRNAVVHGIEAPGLREALGKDSAGSIEVGLRQVGNEVRIEVRDDGAGLDLPRIAERARAAGLLAEDARPTEAELAGLIFKPGFTTVEGVNELAGRGIGMDVVRSEVTAMGGRIETSSAAGRGTAFQLVLPLTTAVTQVVLLDCDGMTLAVPSTLVELVRRVPVAEVLAAYDSGVLRHGEREMPFFWLGGLVQHGARGPVEGRTVQVLIIRSASQRVAVHVGDVLGNHEVVVKNLGPQLSRLPGLAGMSLLANGDTVLIYNPVALASVYGDEARRRMAAAPAERTVAAAPTESVPAMLQQQAPLVMVVDDSLTVRRVTQRLLLREGYRVALARDGLEALELLAAERPAVMLSDIEMPRMDGFDLVRNVRADSRWHDLPVIMITSRIAQKHRDHARELGVEHYLGKPYDEEALLSMVRESLPAHAAALS